MTNRKTNAIAALTGLLLVGCLGEARVVETSERTLSAADASAVTLDMGAGDLTVIGEEGREELSLEVELRTHRAVFDEDDAAADALTVTLEASDEGTLARVRFADGAPSGYFADVVLRVPSRFEVRGEDGSGDARVSDVASLDLLDGSGDLEVARVPGRVVVDDGSGGVLIEDVGPTFVFDGSGTLEIRLVEGDLEIEDDDGDVFIAGVSGSLRLTQGSGDVTCTDVRGDVDVNDGSGGLSFARVGGTVRVEDGSGDVDAEDVGALVMISDGSGEVHER